MKGQYNKTKASNPVWRENWDKIFKKEIPVIVPYPYEAITKKFYSPKIIYDSVNYGVVAIKSRG